MSTNRQSGLEQEVSVGKGNDLNFQTQMMTSALVQVVQDAHKKHEQQLQAILNEFRTEHKKTLATAVDCAVQKAIAIAGRAPSESVVPPATERPHNFSVVSGLSQGEPKHRKDFEVVPSETKRTPNFSAASDASQGQPKRINTDASRGKTKHKRQDPYVQTRDVSGSRSLSPKDPYESEKTRNFDVHDNNKLASLVSQAALGEDEYEEEGQYASLRSRLRRPMKHILENPRFDYFIATMNIANAVAIAIQTNEAALHVTEESPEIFHQIDLSFTLLFAVELSMRIFVEKSQFIFGRNRNWNAFDTCVVASAIFDHVMQMSTNATAIRVLRIMRLIRIIRVIRSLRAFDDLRAMVKGIMSSVLSLVWAVVLLFVILFVISIFITQMVTSYRSQEIEELHTNKELDDALCTHFGSMSSTMYSLYKAITGGDDWSTFADLLFEISNVLGNFFCFYIAFATLAVLNVITAVFVDNAIRSSQTDLDTVLIQQNEERKKYALAVTKLFNKADTDGNNELTLKEFEAHLTNPLVQAYFRHLDLEIDNDEAHALFSMLDYNDTGTIDVQEFIFGCGHLRGNARSFEMAKMHYRNRSEYEQMRKELKSFGEEQSSSFEALLESFGTIRAQFEELQQMHWDLDVKVDGIAKLDQQRFIDHNPSLMSVCKEGTKKHVQCVESVIRNDDIVPEIAGNDSHSEDVPEEVVKRINHSHSQVVHQASSSETPYYKVSSLVEGPPQPSEMPAHKLSTLVEEPSQPSETPDHEVITLVEEAPQSLEMSDCMDAHELVRAAHHTSSPQRSPELCSTQPSLPKQASESKSPKKCHVKVRHKCSDPARPMGGPGASSVALET